MIVDEGVTLRLTNSTAMRRSALTLVAAACLVALMPPLHASAEPVAPNPLELIEQADSSRVAPSAKNEALALKLSKRIAAAQDASATVRSLGAKDLAVLKAYTVPVSDVSSSVSHVPIDDAAGAAAHAGLAPDGVMAPMATGCWNSNSIQRWKAAAGNDLYSVQLQHRWCAVGTPVTSASLLGSWGQTHWVGWSHGGRLSTASGVVGNTGRTYVQHRFTFGSGGWVIQEVSPCVRHVGTQAGAVFAQHTCGIY